MANAFAESVRANCQKILTHVDAKCYSIVWQLFISVVRLSPSPSNPGDTAKGLLANQWYPQVGRTFSSELTNATSPYGSASLSRITSLANKKEFYMKDGAMTMTNNVPYVLLAEKLGWEPPKWSGNVAPYRMVERSLLLVAAENR